MKGKRLKKARQERGWTQAKLARRIGVKRSSLANFENGHRAIGEHMAKRIDKVLTA